MKIAIIAITANGARIGAKLRADFSESLLFVIEKHAKGTAIPFSSGLQTLVESIWHAHDGFIFIMATGIVVRTILPFIKSKESDPAVVVIDDAARFAISLLSGHLGGANLLATSCSKLLDATPVITTATDLNELPSFDMLAKDNGWIIEDLSKVKILNAALLEGKEIAVLDYNGKVKDYFSGKSELLYLNDIEQMSTSSAKAKLIVTNQTASARHLSDNTLILRPKNLVLGIGCNRNSTIGEIESVVTKNLQQLSLSIKSVKYVATAKAKADEAGLLEFVAKIGVEMRCYDSEELNSIDAPSPPSEQVLTAIGAKGVAEPAALLASNSGKLLLHKIKDGNITLAIAQSA